MRAWIALTVLLAGCAARNHWYFSDKPHDHDAHWSYEGATGPEHWGDLSPEFRAAKEGRQQSPIDIRRASALDAHLPPIEFHYRANPAVFVNNGHTLQHTQGDRSWIVIADERYDLRQFHFHTPSEHTIDGRHARAEIHLVHGGEGGKTVVIAILVEEGAIEPELADAIHAMPHDRGGKATVGAPFDVSGLLPKERGYYKYEGSFTTPPCTEGVTWIVMKDPFLGSSGAIDELRSILGANNRPVQPLNNRTVRD